MKLINHQTSIAIPISIAIVSGIIIFFNIFSAEFAATAQEINISVTPTVPPFTQTLTNPISISTTTPITYSNTIPTLTPTATPIQFTPSPTDISIESTRSLTPSPTPSQNILTNTTIPEIIDHTSTPIPLIDLPQTNTYTQVMTDLLKAYLPIGVLDKTKVPLETPQKVLFCDNPGNSISIPDNYATGIARTLSIVDNRYIADLDVSLDVSHAWVGDLIISLEHQDSSQITTLIHRPGVPSSTYGCGQNNVKAIFDDELTNDAEHICYSTSAAISGIYIPFTPLERYISESIHGNWILSVSDNSSSSTGKLNNWCVIASLTNYPQTPSPTPTSITFPTKATINGISGENQALPLDCESRSAVDWAKFFGKTINEIQFFNRLPESDNPDKGFVGDVMGSWGKIPPNDYGVHAEPVAQLLRDYGLSAYAHRPLSWDALRNEIANNHAVIVWIIDSISNGIPIYYLPGDGLWTIVAKYEHTVIITGYTPTTVSYLNGDTIYTKPVNDFLDSWSALENMAVITYP